MGKEIRFDYTLTDADDFRWKQTIRPALVKVLCAGGVVIVPTETSYLLGGDASRKDTMERVRYLKRRPLLQNMSVMFDSVEKAMMWSDWNGQAVALARQHLPGPVTLILPSKRDTLQYASTDGTLGIRIPGHPFLLDLLSNIDFPVSATSANPHGKAEPYHIDACVEPVDVIWNAGTLNPEPPSTIVDLTTNQPRILRQGLVNVQLFTGT